MNYSQGWWFEDKSSHTHLKAPNLLPSHITLVIHLYRTLRCKPFRPRIKVWFGSKPPFLKKNVDLYPSNYFETSLLTLQVEPFLTTSFELHQKEEITLKKNNDWLIPQEVVSLVSKGPWTAKGLKFLFSSFNKVSVLSNDKGFLWCLPPFDPSFLQQFSFNKECKVKGSVSKE